MTARNGANGGGGGEGGEGGEGGGGGKNAEDGKDSNGYCRHKEDDAPPEEPGEGKTLLTSSEQV